MKTIKLTKMQGCGNDFVIIDYAEYEKTGMKMEDLAKKVCNRNFGVGADGMIVPNCELRANRLAEVQDCADPLNANNLKTDDDVDLGWYFYNSDGSTAQMCGNGMRCFAKYAYDNKLVDKKAFSVQTLAGVIKPELLDNNLVKVNMGKPILEDKKIPFSGVRESFRLLIENLILLQFQWVTPLCNYNRGRSNDAGRKIWSCYRKTRIFS